MSTTDLIRRRRSTGINRPHGQGRLDGAPRDAWEASAAWLDAADFERFRRGLYPWLLNTSSPAGP
ncbi:hypothetical protein, partial [Pseudomonas amygdali]